MLSTVQTSDMAKRDPRRLRLLMERAAELAREHDLRSVFVGIAGREGDLLVPEFITYLESALRVEDAIFCMTRERAVVLLADVAREQAEEILQRLIQDFSGRFPTSQEAALDVQLRCFEVTPGGTHPTAKEILPTIFGPRGRA